MLELEVGGEFLVLAYSLGFVPWWNPKGKAMLPKWYKNWSLKWKDGFSLLF